MQRPEALGIALRAVVAFGRARQPGGDCRILRECRKLVLQPAALPPDRGLARARLALWPQGPELVGEAAQAILDARVALEAAADDERGVARADREAVLEVADR